MSILPLGRPNFSLVTVETHPKKTFSFSSGASPTGSVYVFANRSSTIRAMEIEGIPSDFTTPPFGDVAYAYLAIADTIADAKATIGAKQLAGDPYDSTTDNLLGEDGAGLMADFLDTVESRGVSRIRFAKKDIRRHIVRALPSTGTMAKNSIRKSIFEYYRREYSPLDFAFTNYNSLNFLTGANITSDSCIIYPAPTGSSTSFQYALGTNIDDLPYRPASAFTFDFYIKPGVQGLDTVGYLRAGTVMHMSSCYAISLVSGSEKNEHLQPSKFRIMLQLSHSADTPPSTLNLDIGNNSRYAGDPSGYRSYPNDLTFLSDDNSLNYNEWNHVVMRWGTSTVNDGTGSFIINDVIKGTFDCPSSSIFPQTFSRADDAGQIGANPDALFVGNYFDGPNEFGNSISQFFNTNAASMEGVTNINSYETDDPTGYGFTHPLNAEIHDIKIFKTYRDEQQILTSSFLGPDVPGNQVPRQKITATTAANPEMMFFVGPFFVRESRPRAVPISTRHYANNMETYNPINSRLSARTNIHDVNLENFTREFVQAEYPRLFGLTCSVAPYFPYHMRYMADGHGYLIESSADPSSFTGQGRQHNVPSPTKPRQVFMLGKDETARKHILKRNVTVLPCDNGKFIPNFGILASGSGFIPKGFKSSDFAAGALRFTPFSGSDIIDGFIYGKPMEHAVSDGGMLDLSIVSLDGCFGSGAFSSDPAKIYPISPQGTRYLSWPGTPSTEFGGGSTPMYWISDGTDDDGADPGTGNFIFELDACNEVGHTIDYYGITPFFPAGMSDNPAIADGIQGAADMAHSRPSYMENLLTDSASNAVVIFDISNIFFGDKIRPGSLTLKGSIGATKLTLSSPMIDTVSITLKDNGLGSLYRADTVGPPCTWSNVGTILYPEGIIVIKAPALKDIGELQFEVAFEGHRNVHVLETLLPCPAGLFTTSSNPNYKALRPSDYASEKAKQFVYITSVNLHDENLNIIAKAHLAQPLVKRADDKYMFRLKFDF